MKWVSLMIRPVKKIFQQDSVEQMKLNVLYSNRLWLKTYLNDLTGSVEF